MIDSMLFVVIALAFIFMLISFYLESTLFSVVSIILWFISALGCISYEIPYVYVQGNTVVETTQQVETMYPLAWLFMLFGVIMFLYALNCSIEVWKGKDSKVL